MTFHTPGESAFLSLHFSDGNTEVQWGMSVCLACRHVTLWLYETLGNKTVAYLTHPLTVILVLEGCFFNTKRISMAQYQNK